MISHPSGTLKRRQAGAVWGLVAMPLTAAHYQRRAEEVRTTAKLCRDPKLRGMLREIAETYDDLAKEERLHDCGSDHRRRGATRQA